MNAYAACAVDWQFNSVIMRITVNQGQILCWTAGSDLIGILYRRKTWNEGGRDISPWPINYFARLQSPLASGMGTRVFWARGDAVKMSLLRLPCYLWIREVVQIGVISLARWKLFGRLLGVKASPNGEILFKGP